MKQLLRRPALSVVVVVYRMPDQAERTLRSLGERYQRDVAEREYEVIVVENRSDRLLGAERALACGGNVRYFLREESRRTPVNAVNFGAARARGRGVAIMIDGARLLSPGVLRLALDALRLDPQAAVAVPGYHLGQVPQQEAVDAGYGEAEESALLARIAWPADGYRLFEIAALSLSSREGFIVPSAESCFLACSLERWRAIGGMDTRYDDDGGGWANLDLYKRVLEHDGTRCFMLLGEGTFHQYHGGVTTGTPAAVREQVNARILAQDQRLRGTARELPQNVPVLFGNVHPAAYRFVAHSLERAALAAQNRQPQREK